MIQVARSSGLKSAGYSNLLEAAGAIRLLITLMMYSGSALIATMTASFHANPTEATKVRSVWAGVSCSIYI